MTAGDARRHGDGSHEPGAAQRVSNFLFIIRNPSSLFSLYYTIFTGRFSAFHRSPAGRSRKYFSATLTVHARHNGQFFDGLGLHVGQVLKGRPRLFAAWGRCLRRGPRWRPDCACRGGCAVVGNGEAMGFVAD